MAKGNNINIGVGADISGLKSGMEQAAQTVQAAGSKMESAAKDATAKTETAFKNLSQAYRTTAKDAQEIAYKQGITSAAFEEAAAKARDYKAQLDQVNVAIHGADSMGVPFQKSKIGFDGLSNSINQLTREMPAFTYSVQTGFMALSNNIPIFVDQINSIKAANATLAASGQPVQSVLSQIGAAVFSWNTALSLAITGITVFAPKIMEMVSGTDAASESFKKAEISLADFNKEISLYLQTSEIQKQIAAENEKYDKFTKSLKAYVQIYEAQRDILALGDRKMDDESIKRYNESRTQLAAIEKQHQENLKKIKDDAIKQSEKGRNVKDVIQKDVKRKDAVFNPISDAIDLSKWGENLALAQIPLTNFVNTAQNEYLKFQEITLKFNEQINETIQNGIVNAFVGMSQAIGESIATGASFADAAAQVLLGSIGSMAIQLGQLAIGTGIAVSGIKKALLSLNPATAIAAGIALVALGSFVSSKAKSIAGGSGGGGSSSFGGVGGYSPSNGYSGFTPNDNQFSINSRLIGTDLLLSVQKSNKRMERIR